VTQVVEAVRTVQPCHLERLLHPMRHARLVQRPAGGGMREHEIVVSLPVRPLKERLEFAGDFIGHRHTPSRTPGLRRAEFAADVVLAYTNSARRPVDVAPAQRDQLALAQPGHRGRPKYRPVDRTEHSRPGVPDQQIDLVERQEADLRRVGDRGQVYPFAWVRRSPAAPWRPGEVEQRRQCPDHVADRLRR